jgi:hypothetical protein
MSEKPQVKLKWTNRKKAVVVVVAILFLIIVPIFTHLFWEIHESKGVFRTFQNALIAKNYQTAYNLTTPALKANVDYAAFVKVLDALTTRVGAFQNFNISEAEVRNDENGHFATIRTRLVFERGQLPFVFILKRESDRWLIYSFNEQ